MVIEYDIKGGDITMTLPERDVGWEVELLEYGELVEDEAGISYPKTIKLLLKGGLPPKSTGSE